MIGLADMDDTKEPRRQSNHTRREMAIRPEVRMKVMTAARRGPTVMSIS